MKHFIWKFLDTNSRNTSKKKIKKSKTLIPSMNNYISFASVGTLFRQSSEFRKSAYAFKGFSSTTLNQHKFKLIYLPRPEKEKGQPYLSWKIYFMNKVEIIIEHIVPFCKTSSSNARFQFWLSPFHFHFSLFDLLYHNKHELYNVELVSKCTSKKPFL
jgi:hypothetical protein